MKLHTLEAWSLRDLIRDGSVTSTDIVESFLDQIRARDAEIGAYITVCGEQALEAAKHSDERRREGRTLSDWDGIPAAIKDNISVKGVANTCGSHMLAQYRAPYDAHVVSLLKQAGMPILGKTNMDEFAMGSSTEFSALKTTRNPWDRQKVPGGSSGGSAAAVASHQAPWALGSDTGGSVREPAAFCGLVGIKPTYGRVSRRGLVAFASSLDQIGMLTHSVRDGAALLQLLAGHDELDSTSVRREVPSYESVLGAGASGLRVGLLGGASQQGLQPEIHEALEQAACFLADQGAEIQEHAFPLLDKAIETYYLVATAEASSNLARYDGVRYGLRVEGSDTGEMFRRTRSEGFGPEVKRRIMLGTYALSAGYYEAYYRKAQQVRTMIRDGFLELFEKVDVLLGPTTAASAFGFGEKPDPLQMYLTDIYTVPANLAGLPAIHVPVGLDHGGLPIGLQITASPFAETNALRSAAVLETFARNRGWNR